MERRLVSFDWALKRLLRSKANFVILEGFLTELLGEEIRIEELLESESNQSSAEAKHNRVDLKCRNQREEIVLIEVQYERQDDFLSRTLYGVSQVIVEHLKKGAKYGEIPKVLSVNLVHFPLGRGKDYVYRGTTRFMGLHAHDELQLSEHEREVYGKGEVFEVFPEYYLLRINDFDGVAKDGLDEWMAFLKTETIPEQPRGKGLREAKESLDILRLPQAERAAYKAYENDLHLRASLVDTHYGQGKREGLLEGKREGLLEGKREGLLEGKREGLLEGKREVARRLLAQGLAAALVAEAAELTLEEVQQLRLPDEP